METSPIKVRKSPLKREDEDAILPQLVNLIEEYKINYEAAEEEINELQKLLLRLSSERAELMSVLQYSDVYLEEMEESIANLDRELIRSQGNNSQKDTELVNLRKMVQDKEAQEKRRSDDMSPLEKEIEFLRKERKRLLLLTGNQEKDMDEYEELVVKQQANILQLSLRIKDFETAAELRRARDPSAAGRDRSKSTSPRDKKSTKRQPSEPYSPLLESTLNHLAITLQIPSPTPSDAVRDEATTRARRERRSPREKAGDQPKEKVRGRETEQECKGGASKSWSEQAKHAGIFQDAASTLISYLEDSDDEESKVNARGRSNAGCDRSGNAVLPPPPPKKGQATSRSAEGSDQSDDNESEVFQVKVISREGRGSMARSIYRQAKEALISRRRLLGDRRENGSKFGSHGEDQFDSSSMNSDGDLRGISTGSELGSDSGMIKSRPSSKASSRSRSSASSVVPITTSPPVAERLQRRL